jgi:hypothetical protein
MTTQNKTLLATVLLGLFLGACAKSPSTKRTVRQSGQQVVNPNVSTASAQAATSQNLFYEITSLSRPDENVQVVIEIKTPDGYYIPITTDHASGQLDARGVYDDTRNGAQLEFRARCSNASCDQYTLLMTVIKNQYAYHQTAAVSYRMDCEFNVEQLNAAVTRNFYTSLDSVITKFASYGVRETGLCSY